MQLMYPLVLALVIALVGPLAAPAIAAADATTSASEQLEQTRARFEELKKKLRQTSALSLPDKLRLKFDLEGLLDELESHHEGHGKRSLRQIRDEFNQICWRLASRLIDEDPELATEVIEVRKPIWTWLASNEFDFRN